MYVCEEKTKVRGLELTLYFHMKHLDIAKSDQIAWSQVEGQQNKVSRAQWHHSVLFKQPERFVQV